MQLATNVQTDEFTGSGMPFCVHHRPGTEMSGSHCLQADFGHHYRTVFDESHPSIGRWSKCRIDGINSCRLMGENKPS